MDKNIVLVVPCYNEEKRLRPEVFMTSLAQNSKLNWLFVDDGSKDDTYQVLESMARREPNRIFLHKLEKNCGKGEAVRQGLLLALERNSHVTGYFDADLATPMSEVFRLLDIFEGTGHKFLFGARVLLLGRHVERRWWRFWLGRCFALVASRMLKLKVYDTQCGAKLIRNHEGFRSCLENPFKSSWLFDVELINRLMKIGGLNEKDFYEEPLMAWTDVGGSKVKARAFLVAIFDLLKIRFGSLN